MVEIKFDKNFETIEKILKHVNPFLVYLRIFGVFPYKIVGAQLKYSWWGVIQTFNLYALILWGFSHFFEGDPFNEVLSKFEQMQFVGCAMFGLAIFLLQYKRFKRHVETVLIIGNQVLNVDEAIAKLIKLQLYQFFMSAIFIAYFHFGPIFISSIILGIWLGLTNKLYFFFFFFTNTFYLVEAVFIHFLFAIGECFRCINQKVSVTTNTSIIELTKLFKLHSDLSDVVIDLNSMFSVQLVISTWISFFEILFSSYYGILFIVDRDSYDSEETIFGMYLIIWGLFHVLRFRMLCSACDDIKKQANDLSIDIHRLMNVCSSDIIREKLFEYSCVIYNSKFQISGLGFFKVDYTLCHNVISGIATYLVIFLQFKFQNSQTPLKPTQKLGVSGTGGTGGTAGNHTT